MDSKRKGGSYTKPCECPFPKPEEIKEKQIMWDQGKKWTNFNDLDLGFQ